VVREEILQEERISEDTLRYRRKDRRDSVHPAARMIRYYGYRLWSKMVGCGRRWMAEAATSRFKALFGEYLLSRKPRWMDSELAIKAFIYNMLLKAVTT
jgi:hypothetical protein